MTILVLNVEGDASLTPALRRVVEATPLAVEPREVIGIDEALILNCTPTSAPECLARIGKSFGTELVLWSRFHDGALDLRLVPTDAPAGAHDASGVTADAAWAHMSTTP